MAEFVCKYADAQGAVHQQIELAETEQQIRQRLADRGMLVYAIKPRRSLMDWNLEHFQPKGRRLNLEQFLIFNQQFVTLARAGLPVLKSLELLIGNVKNRKLADHLRAIHSQVKTGTPLSQAFQSQGIFPAIYTTSLMAGEKSGSLPEVIDRYVQYQKVALAVRKKIKVSLIYPSVLVVLVLALVAFLVTFVIPEFAALYESMDTELPYMTQLLVSVGLTVSDNLALIALVILLVVAIFLWWMRLESAHNVLDRLKRRIPVFGPIWVKHQTSQLCRLMSTLLQGGIPLMQTLETTGQSLGSRLFRNAILRAQRLVREGKPLSESFAASAVFPTLSIEMIHVGESTGALPLMLNSVAEFLDDDVNTMMTAALSLIEPAIMIFMGIFVAFVLVSLYLPIFSLAERI